MNDEQLLRYSRHILLDEIDIQGQEKLLAAHALILGAGGLGSPAALYLAAAGLGTLTIVDDDVIELSNLQRQIMHAQDRVGQLKVHSAQRSIQALNPDVRIRPIAQRADASLLTRLVAEADIVLDCGDNYATRQALNAACVQNRKPLVSGAAIRFDGQLAVYDLRHKHSPCYACVFAPDEQAPEAQCSTMGVFAPLVGLVGSLQASEALKLLCELPDSLAGAMLMIDIKHLQFTRLQMQQRSNCRVCASGRSLT